MNVASDIASARALFEKAERESDPELKAHALEDALSSLASLDVDAMSHAERTLVGNLRMAHTRRLLVQIVGLRSVSLDAWFEYAHLLFTELRAEVEQLTQSDPELRDNYARFRKLWGPRLADILQGR